MVNELACCLGQRLRDGDRATALCRFDMFPGKRRVLQFVSSPAERAELDERAAELVADRLVHDQVPACLRRPKSLLSKESRADEPGRVVGQDEGGLRIVVGDLLRRVEAAFCLTQPGFGDRGRTADAVKVAFRQKRLDGVGTFGSLGNTHAWFSVVAKGILTTGRVEISCSNASS